MNKFVYDLLEPNVLVRDDRPHGRVYVDSAGHEYDSVTTLLGRLPTKKKILEDWRRRVGDVEANSVMVKASARGTRIHNGLEKYLLGDTKWATGISMFDLDAIVGIKKHIDANVQKIYGIEHQLYSKELKTAGTADLICCWSGVNVICDFKTSKWMKKRKDINDYFLQSAAYAIMTKERHNITIDKIVILMHVDHDKTQIFVEDVAHYATAARKLFPRLAAI